MENTPPSFSQSFREQFEDLVRWRRDVRRFRIDPIPDPLFRHLLMLASLSPSVGYSQPWRFVCVRDSGLRAGIRSNFLTCNKAALESYEGPTAELYATLKLSGLDTAPEHVAVFCDTATTMGRGLGQQTMPEMKEYSAVIACHTLWLASRVHGLGIGWVSILDPTQVANSLNVPNEWKLIAYLCMGYPEEEHLDPELKRHGWEGYQKPELIFR